MKKSTKLRQVLCALLVTFYRRSTGGYSLSSLMLSWLLAPYFRRFAFPIFMPKLGISISRPCFTFSSKKNPARLLATKETVDTVVSGVKSLSPLSVTGSFLSSIPSAILFSSLNVYAHADGKVATAINDETPESLVNALLEQDLLQGPSG